MVNVNINLDSKAARKFLDVLANGIGALSRSWLTRRDARATGDAMRMLAEASAESRALLEGSTPGADAQLATTSGDSPGPDIVLEVSNFEDRIKARLHFQERKRQLNLESISSAALEQLSEEVSEEEVEPDWISRFFDYAQDVSDEDLQRVWGRLLAGEIEQPGAFSLRTLECMRNVSAVEAKRVSELLAYTVGDRFIPQLDTAFWESKGFPFADFALLSEIGALMLDGNLVSIFKNQIDDKYRTIFTIGRNIFDITHINHDHVIKIPSFTLTTLGKDLYRLSEPTNDEDYIRHFMLTIEGNDRRIRIADVTARYLDGRIEAGEFQDFQ